MLAAIPFLLNYVVPAAKLVGAGLKEFPPPENAEVVSGGKRLKRAAESVGRQTLKKQIGSISKQKKIIPTKSTKQASW